jgi:signal peptidase I
MRFTEILFVATLVTGLIWLIDSLFFKPKRNLLSFSSDKKVDKAGLPEPKIVEYSKAFFPILLIVLLVRSFLVEPFRIPSGSMRPTLLEGDFIVVNKYNYGLRVPFTGSKFLEVGTPKRGDVVVFKHMKKDESIDMIKRVVGLPGDHIEYKNKKIYVNGKPAEQESIGDKMDNDPEGPHPWQVRHASETLGDIRHDIYMHTDHSHSTPQYHFDNIVVPANSYFVMGDNRDNSDDSRYWGFVNDQDILGRAMGIWMSYDGAQHGFLNCLRECIRWQRIGQGLGTKIQQ